MSSSSKMWVTAGAIGGAGLTVVGFRVIGEVVGPAEFGHANLLYGVTLLIGNLGAGPVAQAVGRYYFDARDGMERSRLLWSGMLLAGFCFVLGVGLLASLTALHWVSGAFSFALLFDCARHGDAAIYLERVATVTVPLCAGSHSAIG